MILTESRAIYDAVQFVSGLDAATLGIVRIVIGTPDRTQAISTGWLITDSLVLLPAYALTPDWASGADQVHVVLSRSGESLPATPEPRDGATGRDDLASSLPLVLRLARPVPKRALQLAIAAPRVSEPVFLLHHPQGEPALMVSMGRLVGQDGAWLRYDADTEGGSGGAPVLSAEWRVLGMHSRAMGNSSDPTQRYNEGVTVAAMLDALRTTDAWREIAAYHGLADVAGAREEIATTGAGTQTKALPETSDEQLLPIAVRWTVDPRKLDPAMRERVAGLVIGRSDRQWRLRGNERTRLIATASIEQLRAAAADDPKAIRSAGQGVIDGILAGPPYRLDAIEERDLPFWLQAVRWFAPAIPDLPTPGAIHRALARRRIRSRLTEVAGPSFRGRRDELARLGAWLSDDAGGPIAITGIGGIGKSALVAKLAEQQPAGTVLLWLDFDRADLAPDDPVSVLSILFEQLSLEIEGLELPRLDSDAWEQGLDELDRLLAKRPPSGPILLVLDGFEVAQHAPRHEKIWELLERFLQEVPQTRIIVSGRAPVGDVHLAGRPVRNLHLSGLGRADAEAWLREAGVRTRDVLDPVLDLCRGVPLIIRLAVGWLQSGGKVKDLPAELPERMVEGFLYQRILDRVIDDDLRPLAADVLVLRSLTPDMLEPIAGDSLPRGVPPDKVFGRLAQEMALVGNAADLLGTAVPVSLTAGSDRLVLRPEVRTATVHLLETANRSRVRTIDRRAARWYASQPLDAPGVRAELVYHLLRAGDLHAAAEAWRIECAPFLVGAEDELPVTSTRARAWLRRVTARAHTDEGASQRAWETDAFSRIKAVLSRGLERGVTEVLMERGTRAPDSPLTVYDAWTAWRAGNLDQARSLLEKAPKDDGPVSRDRTVLAARLAIAANDSDAADDLLATIEPDSRWQERPQAVLDAATVTAARIRLAIDLDAELELSQILRGRGVLQTSEPLPQLLPATDVVLPLLARRLSETAGLESLGQELPIPLAPDDFDRFTGTLDGRRSVSAGDRSFLSLHEAIPPGARTAVDAFLAVRVIRPGGVDPGAIAATTSAARLEVLAFRRWSLVDHSLFLARACDVMFATGQARDPQALAVAATLGAFVGNDWAPFRLVHPSFGSLERLVRGGPLELLPAADPPPTVAQLRNAVAFLMAAAEEWSMPPAPDLARYKLGDAPPAAADVPDPAVLSARAAAAKDVLQAFWSAGPALDGIGVYVLSPDPLEVLVRRVLGVPDQLAR